VPHLGVHVSIAGGLDKAVQRAEQLGCSIFQIFLRNPRSFRLKEYGEEEARVFKECKKKAQIAYVVGHCVYTQNLISSSKKVYRFSIDEFVEDAKEAAKLDIRYLVTHTGSYKGATHEEGMKRLTASLTSILGSIPSSVRVLLENSAGTAHSLGSTIRELGRILNNLKRPQNLGICLDTCHLFAAGYDLRRGEAVETLFSEIKKYVGITRLGLIHLNDSKYDAGAFKDRHEHIGKGKIGLTGIKSILRRKELARAGFILETPKETEDDDSMNLAAVRKLFEKSTGRFDVST